MKKLLSFSIFTIFCLIVSAHEFWLHPVKFLYEPGELINIKLMVGENYEGENWKGNSAKVRSLELHLSDAVDDLTEQLKDSVGDSLRFAIYDEGTYLVCYHSNTTYIELDSTKFLEYLREDGLQNVIDYRAAHHENDSTGREVYQRSVKTIFQVGNKKTALYKKSTGLPLDIIPQQNPYDSARKNISVKILFQEKPLASQLVKVWHRVKNETVMTEVRTDEKGMISFPLITNGRWMVSTVKMERAENDPKAQWQSWWGSCTWGYE